MLTVDNALCGTNETILGTTAWHSITHGHLPLAILLSVEVMTSSIQLERLTSNLERHTSNAVPTKTFSDQCQSDNSASTTPLILTNISPGEADRNRRSALSLASRTQALLNEPADFIQHLNSQVCCNGCKSREACSHNVHSANSSLA